MLKKHLLLSMLKIAVLPFCENRETIFFLMNGKFKDTPLIEIEYNIIEYYCVCIKKCYFLGQKLSSFSSQISTFLYLYCGLETACG